MLYQVQDSVRTPPGVSFKYKSTDGNSLEAQERLLKEHGAEIIYMDSFTGTKITRPEFDKLLKVLKSGDTLVVAKLDRFARSVSQASDLITKLIDDDIRVDVCVILAFWTIPV